MCAPGIITCKQIHDRFSCDNCNRLMPFGLKYEFANSRKMPYVHLILCEDCSTALSNLHFKVMENGKIHKYDLDEITEVKADGTK